ncbi:multicopper oxidase domain-containing protein [Pengzhenrongella phosphoraccumulans]|uniref:multicopper oxidase domain-containing protein n=1 Tax=Pengzhenrongella phosphoraccumulans TaxID=3114394 RepID=UPI003890242B
MTSQPFTDHPAAHRPIHGSVHRVVALVASASMVATFGLLVAPSATAVATRAPAVSTAVSAAAVGKLAPQGCTVTGTVAACDLYALAGTTSMLGTPLPIWGFASTATAPATAPGPVLVVNQGDTVSVTLHNALAEPVSLAFPGQPASAFSAGLSGTAEEVGTAPGAATTYTFTAGRAGTFAYEAGHTAGGARQVAMGLAGALVVRPADGSAYGSPAGFPATTYDDDAVVVLSELDPALNAAPATFDMRNFAPAYRLINGKPYPSTDPISTDQGHKVLVRYVNVGSQTHTMSLLGADQTQVATDGHALQYAETAVVMTVDPGATADTIVTMPSGPEAKIALYESAGRLDNAGQKTADPLAFAFGGMLTFLDTAAPPPSTDIVGPVSTHVVASPNPSNGLVPVTVTADLSDASTGGSTVTQAELVVDDAVTTGVGFGTAMTGAFGAVDVAGATGTITTAVLDALPAGKHTVYVRALDSAGNWGVVGGVVLNLPKVGPQTTNGSLTDTPANGSADVVVAATGDDADAGTITGAEYFLDTVGATGTGQTMARNRTAAVVSESATIPAATVKALGEGVHHVLVRSLDSLGLWGPTLDIPLTVDLTGPTVLGADISPNPTNGLLAAVAQPGNLVVSTEIIDKDARGGAQSVLVDAEGFLDPKVASPPGGTGFQLVPVDGAMNNPDEKLYGLIPLSQARSLTNGAHQVFVRGLDAAGNWGELFAIPLTVDKAAPVLGAVVGTPNPTNGAANLTLTAPVNEVSFATAEFWVGGTDPGVGKATRIPVALVGTNIVATVPLAGITAGGQQFNLRVQDLAGNWSNAVSTTVTVSMPNAIFSDTFNSGTLAAWSASTGGVVVTAAAAIPVGGANRGLAVTLAGGTGNRPSFVTDNTPTGETGYHASFAFNANTLTSGTTAATVLTLFQAQTAAGGQVFAVQFHRTGGVAQIRAVMSRTGAGALTGNWVTLPAGVHTIRVDWTSGPATGTAAGSLRLVLDGTNVSTQAGNTSALRVDTVLLGVTAGVTQTRTSTMAGTAYFDTFTSTRLTLP